MPSGLQDLRFGARLLRRAPAFTAVAVASLAPGIGANAAIFGAITGLLVTPNYFDVPGLQAVAGRLPGGSLADGPPAPAIVVTHRYWRRRFNGLYGMLARTVAQRSREIGDRLALGAAPRSIVRLVLGEGWRFAAVGLAAGLAMPAAGARLLGSFLPGISPLDAAAYGATTLLLGSAATMAMWLPVRRALAVDPARTLRSE